MDVIYLLIPLSVIILTVAVVIFFWAVRSGQFQDLDSPAVEILFDNDNLQTNVRDTNNSDINELASKTKQPSAENSLGTNLEP